MFFFNNITVQVGVVAPTVSHCQPGVRTILVVYTYVGGTLLSSLTLVTMRTKTPQGKTPINEWPFTHAWVPLMCSIV